ncbi:MAG: non-hydrolyzing UDP-N-acetylglucosamine 2-epimerase [Candidatus Hodarchaeales archaeon]|jgi:UDP-N-acetylglucosamine 2-epimerase
MTKKYVLVTGTRPQIIKSAPILKSANLMDEIEIVHIFTGQHYDSYLADIFFETLSLRPPHYQLDVRSGTTDYHIREIIRKLTPILKREQVIGILVPGDTNSALAAGLTGMFQSIPVLHIESGLRSYDLHMQEEINRRLIDHASSVLFSPTKIAVNNLKDEAVLGKVVQSGDTMYDLLLTELDEIKSRELFSSISERYNLSEKDYMVLTVHRRENLKSAEKLHQIFGVIEKSNIKTIFPIHPHTRKIIGEQEVHIPPNVKMIDPLSYHQFLNLVSFSGLVMTDSGGLQKETYLLSIPCVTLRSSTEWLETVEFNANVIVGTNPVLINQAIEEMYNKPIKTDSSVYGDGKASEKIVSELSEQTPQIPTVKDP